MHITFIIQDMYLHGTQYVTSLLANGLSERGHEVDIVVSGIESKLKKERADLSPFSVSSNINKIELSQQRASRNVFQIRNYIKSANPDVIVPLSQHYLLATILALKSIPGAKSKIIYAVHSGGIGMNIKKASPRRFVNTLLAKLSSTMLMSSVDHFIAVSKGVKEAIVQTSKVDSKKVDVVYNPIIDSSFHKKVSLPPKHLWLNTSEKNTPTVVAAGAHVPIKGYENLIYAIRLINESIKCKLILFGEGEFTPTLKKLVANLHLTAVVDFPGYTINLPAEIKHADVFVVSSHAESFSVVLVEALAAGTPVVSTNCPSGPPEILKDGQYGILVEPNSPNALAEGIQKVLSGKGITPPEESWAPYTLEKVSAQYEAVIQKVLLKK